jgi:hypothetical protein
LWFAESKKYFFLQIIGAGSVVQAASLAMGTEGYPLEKNCCGVKLII